MQNVIIMNAHRIANKRYQDDHNLQLKDFDLGYLQRDIISQNTVGMSDLFIVTDTHYFKVLKSRCCESVVPVNLILPLAYLKTTLKLFEGWQG